MSRARGQTGYTGRLPHAGALASYALNSDSNTEELGNNRLDLDNNTYIIESKLRQQAAPLRTIKAKKPTHPKSQNIEHPRTDDFHKLPLAYETVGDRAAKEVLDQSALEKRTQLPGSIINYKENARNAFLTKKNMESNKKYGMRAGKVIRVDSKEDMAIRAAMKRRYNIGLGGVNLTGPSDF